MPAVQLARLEKQIAALQPLLAEPRRFVARLEDLLAFYSDPARRISFAKNPAPLLSSYHVPPQVIRTLVRHMAAWVGEAQEQGLQLCAVLWDTHNLECRQMAAGLLGGLPVDAPEPLWEVLEAWLADTPEMAFQEQILALGSARLRKEQPASYQRWLTGQLHRNAESARWLGLLALRLWLEEPDFDNFPLVLRWLRLLSNSLPAALRPDYLRMLKILAQRSPQETVAFLQELRQRHDTPQMRAMLQRARAALPEPWQQRL